MMITKNIRRRNVTDINPSLAQLPQKIQQILAARKIQSPDDLDYSLAGMLAPDGLANINIAAAHLYSAIADNQSILVIGDFDADGATSSAVMIRAMKSLGATKLNYLVPDRFKFGYGLSVALVEYAASLNPDLIVTVDNGIANIDGVNKANELGIEVIITDHHLPGEKLPEALAIVNPNQRTCEFKSKNLAGVGVAFYLMLALRALMRQKNWFSEQQIKEPNFANLLDIVALGTVADVVVLDKNNRILVEQGLQRIRAGRACSGIKALLRIANRNPAKIQASDLGFALGPRINAAGRLDDMSIGIECLLADNEQQAFEIATKLDRLNLSRRDIEQQMLQQAKLDIEAYLDQALTQTGLTADDPQQNQESPSRPIALCLYDPDWHQGVIGILASRVKEKINRPVIVFADGNSKINQIDPKIPQMIKGSCRSVKGVHIRDVLALVDSQHPQLIEKYGGHAMAAGLSIKQTDFKVFTEAFYDAVEVHLNGEAIEDEILSDGGLSSQELTLSFAKSLSSYGPWGQGFVEPLFDDEFEVVTSRIVGEDHLKLVLQKQDNQLDAIFFRCPDNARAQPGDRVNVVYKLDINEFRGDQNLQLMVEQLTIFTN